MAHVPHVHLPGPWDGAVIELAAPARHHLERVMRKATGAQISYTDGAGRLGRGTLVDGTVRRGEEEVVVRPRTLTVAMGTPRHTERARFAVEKLGELGVARLRWLRTKHGQGSPPRRDKAQAWAIAALQQSRGAYLLDVDGPIEWADAGPASSLVVADPDGASVGDVAAGMRDAVLVVGPEGGFAPGEIPDGARRCGLGERILRSETAAVVAAALVMEAWRRS